VISLTKELKIQETSGRRRIRVSTNFLDRFGFSPETRLAARLCGTGFDLVPTSAMDSPWKVHRRSYPQRRNNPTESVIDISLGEILSPSVPCGVDRLHYTFTPGRIQVRPVYEPLFHVRRSMKSAPTLASFMAMSSGLDAHAFHEAGFDIRGLLEYRPNEARDKIDLTESGVCTFLANHRPSVVFNEDISRVDMRRVRRSVARQIGTLALLQIGLQCDDFTTVKSPRLKREEMATFRPSSRELGHYALRLVEMLSPATVMVENVAGWHGSEAQAIFGAVLTRLGYHVQAVVLDASDFGALTLRPRCYLVASCWPGFAFPAPTGRNATPLSEVLRDELPYCRDVSHTSAVHDARGTPRARFCPLSGTVVRTVLKSQARQAKDSLYFQDDQGALLLPSLKALKILHGLPESFNLDQVGHEVAVEQIGQGVDIPLHQAVAAALRSHILSNCKTLPSLLATAGA
jgi:DNA (cytosine-5)-methyltransferase 1